MLCRGVTMAAAALVLLAALPDDGLSLQEKRARRGSDRRVEKAERSVSVWKTPARPPERPSRPVREAARGDVRGAAGEKAQARVVQNHAKELRRKLERARPADRQNGRDEERAEVRSVGDPSLWRHVPTGGEPIRAVRRRVSGERWHYDRSYVHHTHDHGHWFWHDDPFWFGHDHVFVFRRGHGHLLHHHHHGFGHHHGLVLHHGFFHDFLFHHHGHVHFVILVVLEPVYGVVPVYTAPYGWVIEERDVEELVARRMRGAVYTAESCALLEIVTRQGSVLRIAVDPADFGAENVGELRDVLEEALAATGELDLEDLAGVRHVIPRSSIEEIRGTACNVD